MSRRRLLPIAASLLAGASGCYPWLAILEQPSAVPIKVAQVKHEEGGGITHVLLPLGPAILRAQATETQASLTLAHLLEMAAQNHPDLGAARAHYEAARGRLLQAGLHNNPNFTWEADDLNTRREPAGTQGPIISQVIVTAHKRRYARAAASAGVEAADWQATTQWHATATRVRLARDNVLAALAEQKVHKEVLRLADEALDAAEKLKEAGAGTQLDILRAQVEVEQGRVRLSNAEQQARAAWKLLAVAGGVADLPRQPLAGALADPVPDYEWAKTVETVLTRSSEIHEAESRTAEAELLLLRARAQRVPDLRLAVRPFYSFPEDRMKFKVEAGADLPLFNRNQGNIYAARADAERAREEVRQVELRLTERLALLFQQYRQSRELAESYGKKVVPAAKESVELTRKAYASGDAKHDFTAVVQAQRTLAEAQLAQTQAQAALRRAADEILGLLQESELESPDK